MASDDRITSAPAKRLIRSKNEAIRATLVTAAATAFHRYVELSGDAVEQRVHEMPESFMQSYCAMELIRRHHLFVTIETNRSAFINWFRPPSPFDRKRFSVDMLVFEPNGPDPRNALLRAIVEFKTNLEYETLAEDANRVAKLLHTLRDTKRPVHDTRFGYQVVCVYDKKGKLGWAKSKLQEFRPKGAIVSVERRTKFECKSASGPLDVAAIGILVKPRDA